MVRNIKMIGLDLDGTLLNSKKELTEYTRDVLEKALAQGIVVIVSTGRAITAIPQEILCIPGMKYAVTANGARVLELTKNEVLIENTISVETAKQALEVLEDYNAIKEIFVEGRCYSSEKELKSIEDYFSNPSMADYILNSRTHVPDVKQVLLELHSPVEKVQGVFKYMEERAEALKRLQEIPGMAITDALGNNLEMNKEGTDKGSALLQLGELLGIKQEEIMACGDGMNDYEMLKAVGFAVAMENASEQLKLIADYVTTNNDNEGVAKAIETFALI